MKYLFIIAVIFTSNVKAQLDTSTKAYQTIIELDKTFFEAYNTCTENLSTHASYYLEELEFFHDKGGLMRSKKDVVEGIKNNICGKVTRELVANSVEVHEIPGYGFIQIGYHKFFNKEEPDAISKPSKFILFWKRENQNLKIAKVVSLH